METYSALRQFADSWWLLLMVLFFVGVVLWTFRPGSRKRHQEIAEIPLRDDDPDRLKDDGAADARKRDGAEGEDDAAEEGRNGDHGRDGRRGPKEN
jgi:cytochrome c oxidase cbb3-type subunit 4